MPLLPLLKPAMSLLSKYWVHILIVAIVIFGVWKFADYNYDKGVSDTKASYEEAARKNAEEHNRELVKQQGEYEKLITTANGMEDAANKAKDTAEKEANKYRQQADSYYQKWQESLHNVPISHSDGPHHFTYGYVGMYNLAVQVPAGTTDLPSGETGPSFNLSEIAAAAGLESGASAAALAQDSPITEFELLQTEQHNLHIANTCIAERKIINDYFQKLCDLGFCQ